MQMTLISGSEYRAACAELIRAVMQRPGMYYSSPRELESLINGHAWAFRQLGAEETGTSFFEDFSRWLHEEKGEPISPSGWVHQVERMCANRGEHFNERMAQLADEFLTSWTN